MLTRRVHGRALRLRPSRRTNQIVLYIFAVMAQRTNIQPHALCVLGNHWHPVVTDPEGRVPEFTRECHNLIARHINTVYGDEDSLWSGGQTNHRVCADRDAIIDRMAYSLSNPVKHGLVREGRSWPGVRLSWPQRPLVIRRPLGFFSKDSGWPDEVTLEFVRPPGFDDLSDDELAARIAAETEAKEEKARQDMAVRQRRFQGRRSVRRQSRHARPKSESGRGKRSSLFATDDVALRRELERGLAAWDDSYAACLERWRAGDRDVVFPYGTYRMRVVHAARCAGPPD